MKYIVNSKEVSRDTFYFCERVLADNKTFVLLANNTDVDDYVNEHLDYDYYIRDDLTIYYTKGEAIVKQWLNKLGWSTSTIEDMKKRYDKSKFKDTMTFEEWYTKNGWTLKNETKYEIKCYYILITEDFEEKDVKTKLFSVKVNNDDTVKTINKIKDEYGDCIEYVLRDVFYTEIIYKDTYLEI